MPYDSTPYSSNIQDSLHLTIYMAHVDNQILEPSTWAQLEAIKE